MTNPTPLDTDELRALAALSTDTDEDADLITRAADEIDALRKLASRFAPNWPADVVLDVTPITHQVFARRRDDSEAT